MEKWPSFEIGELSITEKSSQRNWLGPSDAVKAGVLSTVEFGMVVLKKPMVLCENG